MSDSLLSSPAAWAALAAGVGGLAYAVMRPTESSAAPTARSQGARSQSAGGTQDAGSPNGARPVKKAKRKSKAKKSRSKSVTTSADPAAPPSPPSPPSPYAAFVKAQMPGFMKRGFSSPDAMKAIGKLWQAKK